MVPGLALILKEILKLNLVWLCIILLWQCCNSTLVTAKLENNSNQEVVIHKDFSFMADFPALRLTESVTLQGAYAREKTVRRQQGGNKESYSQLVRTVVLLVMLKPALLLCDQGSYRGYWECLLYNWCIGGNFKLCPKRINWWSSGGYWDCQKAFSWS